MNMNVIKGNMNMDMINMSMDTINKKYLPPMER